MNFRPGGAFPFLGLPAGELQNGQAALEALWGSQRCGRLRERLLEARTVASRFVIVEQALCAQITRPLALPAVAFALQVFDSVAAVPTVGEVTRQTGLSRRRFIEVFRDQVGLTPKVYWRLQRFRHVVQRVHRAPGVGWADLALECGYYDQAHLIRDFRAFSGLSPSAYLVRRGEHLNHVPLSD